MANILAALLDFLLVAQLEGCRVIPNRLVSPMPGESAQAFPLSRAAKRAESATKLCAGTRRMVA
jgi:hypothetical protein